MRNVALQTISATFHLTHNCNLRCTYCYTGEKFGLGMTDELADQAVDFCLEEARLKNAGHLEIIFFGGEPLLRKDLIYRIADRVISAKRSFEVSFKMSTNGTLLTEDAIRELAKREVYVSISLDGDAEVQDLQRPDQNGEGSSAGLKEATQRLLEWNPSANVTCVITPESAHCVDRSVQHLFNLGFAYITTTLDYSSPWTKRDLKVLGKSYQRLADWYVEATRDGKKFYISCIDGKIFTRTNGPAKASEKCSMGNLQFSIAPSGRLYPCVQFVNDDRDHAFVIGDIHSGWNEKARSSIHSCSTTEKEECVGCELIDRCSSWCACVNLQSTGCIDKASPLVCEHDQMLTKIADKAANRLWKVRSPHFIHKQYNPAYPVFSFFEDITIKEVEHESIKSV